MKERLSTIARSATGELDDAIDQVAARMTAVEQDDALAARIAQALPERSAWSLHWLMPRLAWGVLAAILLVVVLQPFYGRSTNVLRTEVVGARVPIVEPASNDRGTSVELSAIVRRTPVEPPSNDRRTTVAADRPDHERSLVAIASPDPLTVGSLAPEALPAEASLAVASLVIADLPLPGDFSPR